MSENFDAIVVGAGPAGTTTAALLAERGRRVVLLERERLPRYRLGESLIPYCWYPLDRLGLVERLDASDFIVRKHSVQFVSPEGSLSKPFYFFEHTDHDSARTWQVVRSEFDQLLVQNAIEKGVEIREGTVAAELLEENGSARGVLARDQDLGAATELRAPITIDASGRDRFIQGRRGWSLKDQRLRKMAIWTYYRGAKRDEGMDEGATTIAYIANKGWFWYIPLAGDLVSVGVVADADYLYRDTRDSAEIFERELATQPWVRDHLATGTRTAEHRVTSDFSYRAKHCASDGLLLVGDAFAFLDPVFSSGVYLALYGGVLAADAAEAALQAGDTGADRFREYGERYCASIEAMRALVHAFYDPDFNFAEFLKEHPHFRSDLTDCLIGNLERDYSDFFSAVGRYMDLPGPLSHGGPLLKPSAPARP